MLVHRLFRSLRLRARRRPRRGIRRRVRRSALAGGLPSALFGLAVAAAVPGAAQTPPTPTYRPPVTAPIADSFRPPTQPFGPGNRGIEYDTEPGAEVKASADGQVVFAGAVAGGQHVTLLHDDGVRTSYSFLARVDVVLGQRVRQGDRVGETGPQRFHFGARRGDAYFDPATLFGPSPQVRVELLPFEVPPGATPDQERVALAQLVSDRGGGFGIGLPGLGEIAGWARERAELLHHYAVDLNPVNRGMGLTGDIVERMAFAPPCSNAPPPTRPAAASGSDRVAVLVAGLGSSSDSASIDGLRVDELGYRSDQVMRFSYAGGRTPYVSADTQGDLRVSAQRLADTVEATLGEHPDAPVDIYAHSMGGVLTRLGLQELERRGVDLERIGLVTTFGSPHRGADLATAVAAVDTTLAGSLGLDVASTLLDTGLDPDSEAARQLAETSEVSRELAQSGVPDGIELLSVAASGDVVVTVPNTRVLGARNITVDLVGWNAHGDLVASDEATEEVARALAGEPQGCEAVWEVLSEEVTGQAISYAEDLGGFALLQPGG